MSDIAARSSGIGPDGDWTPAFPGQRPPFRPGHELSTVHGANSPRRWKPIAERHLERYTACAWWLTEADQPTLWELCKVLAIGELLGDWLDQLDIIDACTEVTTSLELELTLESGEVKRLRKAARVSAVLNHIHRNVSRTMRLQDRLGLSPLGRRKLGLPLDGKKPFDLALHWAERAEQEDAWPAR